LKIKFENILFLKSDHIYVEIYTVQNEKYVIRESLVDFESKLNSNFIRIHRSYIVNFLQIDLVEPQTIKVATHQLPLSKQFRSGLQEKIESFNT
jgi:DNA-binding LytR/AlgR family response regulator